MDITLHYQEKGNKEPFILLHENVMIQILNEANYQK